MKPPEMNSLLFEEEGVGAEMRNEKASGEMDRRSRSWEVCVTESTGGYIPPTPGKRRTERERDIVQFSREPWSPMQQPQSRELWHLRMMSWKCHKILAPVSQSIAAVAAGRKLLEGFARLEVVFYWMWGMSWVWPAWTSPLEQIG